MRKIRSIALALAVAALAGPALAQQQYAKAEDAIHYRQGAFTLLGYHFGSLGAMVDGGFAMGSNLPLFAYGEGEGGGDAGTTVINSEGEVVVVPKKADFGTVSSGGLY